MCVQATTGCAVIVCMLRKKVAALHFRRPFWIVERKGNLTNLKLVLGFRQKAWVWKNKRMRIDMSIKMQGKPKGKGPNIEGMLRQLTAHNGIFVVKVADLKQCKWIA